jgi:DNA polymerase III delta prime subunit
MNITLDIPCFFCIQGKGVQREHKGWPILAPHLVATGRNAEQAGWKLLKAIREALKGVEEDLLEKLAAVPENAEDGSSLLTMNVQRRPEREEQEHISRDERGRMELRTSYIRFKSGAHWFYCLPRLHNAILVLPEEASDPAAQGEALQKAVDAWFRSHKELLETTPLYAEDIAEGKGDRLLWLSLSITPGAPVAEEEEKPLKSTLSGLGPVSGARELAKVARCLNDQFPEGLLVDHIPDIRVEFLRELLFVEPAPAPVALVGPPGAGKTTLIHAAIYRQLQSLSQASNEDQAKFLAKQAHIYQLDPNRVIAGMSIIGAWERRFMAILEHMVDPDRHRKRDGLYIDNPLALARVGKSAGGELTLATVLKSWVEERRIPVVLEATPEIWSRLEEVDRSFADLFQVIRVDAPPPTRALEMALSRVEFLELCSGASLEIEGIERALQLELKFPGPRVLPGGLVDRLELLCTRYPEKPVGTLEVDTLFEATTGLRPEIFEPETRLEQDALLAQLQKRLIGQATAARVLADGIQILKAGLSRPNKPLACWLFVGPTGVGKTEAAKVLADTVFSSPEHLLRFDMNEFIDAGAVTRLLGDGVSEGLLTSAVRSRPMGVLLLDEIEKAHPLVHDLLLQLLDEGQLTDARGLKADFQKTFVLLTSNVGAQEIAQRTGFGRENAGAEQAAWVSSVTRHFRPELVNRLDRIVVFQPLSLPQIRAIARLQISRILAREGFLRRTVLLDVQSGALDRLAEAGFNPALGARALKRVLESELTSEVAALLARLPLDSPILLQISPNTTTTIHTRLTPLQFAAPAPVPPAPEKATPEAVYALLSCLPERLFRYELGPQGVQQEGQDVLALREAIVKLAQSLEEEFSPTEVAEHHLARIANSARRLTAQPRLYYRPRPRIDWVGAVSFRSVREFLLDGTQSEDRGEPGALDSGIELSLLSYQVAALRAGKQEHGWLYCIPVVETSELWEWFKPYLEALQAALLKFQASITLWGEHFKRSWQPYMWGAFAPRALALQINGLCLEACLKQESAIHLCFPPDTPPMGLELLWVESSGEKPEKPERKSHEIRRLYICPDGKRAGKTEDMKEGIQTGASVAELEELLLLSWWRALERGTQ